MLCNVMLNAENRIVATSAEYNIGPEQISFEFPDDFDFAVQYNYKIEAGLLVYDPVVEPQSATVPSVAERLAAVEAALLDLVLGGELGG